MIQTVNFTQLDDIMESESVQEQVLNVLKTETFDDIIEKPESNEINKLEVIPMSKEKELISETEP